LTGDRTNYV